MILGELKFKRANDGYEAFYRGPYRQSPRQRLCLVTRAGDLSIGDEADADKWVATDMKVATHPHKTRRAAADAFLKIVFDRQSEEIERTVAEAWERHREARLRDRRLTPEVAAAVYDLLIERCEAPNREKDHFVYRQSKTDEPPITEWRFCGMLGFGGKFWNVHERWYVSAYPEDTNAERRLIIAQTNQALFGLFRKTYGSNPTAPA